MRKKSVPIAAVLVVATSAAFTATRALGGAVQDASCTPLSGVRVSAKAGSPVVTDRHGRFTFPDASAATVTLQAELSGFRVVRTRRHVDRAPLTITMIPQRIDMAQDVSGLPRRPTDRHLSGQILDERCRPLAGASVRSSGRDGILTVRTGKDGRFEFASIDSGTHDLDVTADGFMPTAVRAVTIDLLNDGAVTLALARGAAPEWTVIMP